MKFWFCVLCLHHMKSPTGINTHNQRLITLQNKHEDDLHKSKHVLLKIIYCFSYYNIV